MERHTRLSRAAVVLVAIALIASIAAAVWFASPDAPYVPSEDSGAALGAAAPAEDGTVAEGYQPSSTGTGISSMDPTRSDTDGDFYLTQDITITSLHSDDKWDQAFSGTFDGNGHTITINASHTTASNDAGGMFIGLANGAVIKNLTIVVRGFSLGFSGDTINAGMIAGYAAGEKITIDNVKLVLERTSDGNDPVDDPVNYPVNDPYVYKSNEGIDTAINFGGLIGKVENGTVTISNTTVINNETGTYGFSARNWVRAGYEGGLFGAGAYDSKSWTNVGGFVGSVQAGKEGNGNLTMNYVKYDAADGAKMSAYASSYGLTRQYNYARLSPFLGVLNVGALKVDNLIFNAGGTFTQMFYRDKSTTDEHNEGQYCGRGILIGYDVNKWLQTTGEGNGVSSRTEVYLRNAITGDKGTGLGNGDAKTSLLAGNNSWLDGFMSYPGEIEDASFTDDGKIAFALPNRSGEIAKAIRQIDQNGTVTALTDAQIAEQVTEGGGLTWIEAPIVAHGDDTSVPASLDTVSTGTYSVENYDAVSSAEAGDTAYRGSKVYDGTTVKTPTLKVGDVGGVGGTTVNAWTASSTTADVGTKTFSYNADALSDYATATYNGGTYLVQNGTIYSPGEIIVNDVGQTFALGKDFVYEITKASVTVTPNVPDDDLYTGNPLPALTATAVDSGGSPVEGSIEWDEPDATLSSGKHSYAWTWTPTTSNNYKTVNGSMELEAFDRKIVSLTVQGDYRKEYTAYEPFDPTGVEVIANYSDGTQAKLDDSKYEFTVVNGDINRLVVVNDTVTVSLKAGATVSTTFNIEVSKLVVDVPTAVAGLVYNGKEQIGVENAEHYNLTGNTGTNAANYTATAELKDKDNTEWSTGGTDNVTIPWSIAPMTLDGTVLAPGNLKYDGKEKEAAFESTVGTLFDPDQVTIEYGGVADRTNVTGEAVTATAKLPNNGNYKWAADAPSASFTIDPMPVVIGLADVSGKTYDGNVVNPNSLFTAPNGVDDEGALQLAFVITVDGENRDEILNAGTYTVTAVLADGQTNYTAQSAQARYEIAKVVLTGTLTFDCTATYDGTAKTATFTLTSDNLVGQDKVGEVTYNGVDRINVTGQAIVASVALPSSGNYQWQDGVEPTASLTIVKADPAVTVELSDAMPGNLTVAATLDNDWLVRTDNTGVEGTLAWDKAGELLQLGKVEYGWTFVPTDSNNYNNATGSLSITASEDTLQSITVKEGTYTTEYTAYEDFDPTGLVVIAHYASGTKVEVTSGFTLENDKELTDGQITVTLNGVSTTITVTVNKREIPLPAATEGLIFNGKEQNGIDQKWIEQYAEFVKVEGNSQRDAGDYRATVTLTKNTNYVTWEGGSVGDVTIDWSIAQMTLDGTVSAAGSLEYDGNEKDAAFTVTVGTLCGSDQVTFDYGAGDRINVTDGGFTATAQLPSSGNYKWATDAPSASFTIVPMRVEIGLADVSGKTYDGNVVNSNSLFTAPQGVGGGALVLTVTVDGGKTILNAGSYTITAVLADGQTNYTAQPAQARYEIAKVVLTGTLTFDGTATYDGTAKTATFKLTSDNLVGQDSVGEVTYNDVDRINVTGQAIVASVALPNDNYQWQDGVEPTASLTIVKATPVVNPTADVQGTLYTSDDLYKIALKLGAADTPGTVSWDEGQRLIADEQGYNWTFVPTDSVNYNGATGVIKLTTVQAALTDIRVTLSDVTEYTAYDAFDRGDIVVEAVYGDVVRAVGDYELSFSSGAEERLVAGEITVTVTYTDGDVTQYTEFTINVAKRTVAKPVVDPTVFDATGGTITLPIAESEYYTIYGNTAIEPGRYVASVELKDPANTMWEDGSTDDISIAWTIREPVTSDEVIADILAMEKVTWQNAEEFLDLEARYNALDKSEQTAEATAKLEVLRAQYDALRNAAFDDIEAAHEVTAKSLGKALAAAAAGLSAAAIALAIAKRRSI